MTTNNLQDVENLYNKELSMNGLDLLKMIPRGCVKAAFFDPQYRGVLDHLKYGNEGKTRGEERAALQQMSESEIIDFINLIGNTLVPSGHLFLWVDKYHLCTDNWIYATNLKIVDLIVWNKLKIGMGYRSRRSSEYLLVLQNAPTRAKGVWTDHSIPDVWSEKVVKKTHTHQKPSELISRLIKSISSENDVILDPAAGSFVVKSICADLNRVFIGCDIAEITQIEKVG